MSSLMNIGARALLTNQLALQTAGNNIANVNTPGYSRQSVLLQSVPGSYSGSGYYGNGVEAATVLRSHSDFLTRQATLSSSIAAADSARLDKLKQLEDMFQGGTAGLGASVSHMLNAFSDVASAPTDLSARTSVLARADEMATRFRATSGNLAGLQQGVQTELRTTVDNINKLAQRIARVNDQIVTTSGGGHSLNDLLDQREQLMAQLNGLVQTTSVAADDGSVTVFVSNSQPLVLGSAAATLSISADEFGNPYKAQLNISRGGAAIPIDDSTLGGGSIAGLMRFQNTDLTEAGNLLGRMALALGTRVNEQQNLGLDLTGAAGANLFAMNPIPDGVPSTSNTGNATVQLNVRTVPTSGTTALAASDYELTFTSAGTGSIKRISDGQVTAFASIPIQIDGLDLQVGGSAAAGDRFMLTPFRQAAGGIDTRISSPRDLAMASPVAAAADAANRGTLALQGIAAQAADPNLTQTVKLTFTSAGTFDVTGTGTGNPTGVAYAPGQPISYNGWALTLKGAPRIGDGFTVQANQFPLINGGNAEAMMALRDLPMFDGATAAEGYASLLSQVGVRVQSADFAAQVSKSIAGSAETDRASVAGVNLDEEAAKLLQFQQAYQASAKMLQVSQSVFDALIQSVGR